jgi:hypothetical protein
MAGNFSSAANTGSTTGYLDGRNKTSTSLSTNMLVLVNDIPIGAIQELSVTESRGITMIQELGTDGFVDSVPTSSTKISGSCRRIRYDALRVTEAMGRSFIHLASQVYPFDFVIIDRNRRGGNKISTVIKNVWLTNIQYSYTVNEWIITDNIQWEAEAIYSTLVGSGASAATGGDLGIKSSGPFNTEFVNDIERVVDRGASGRRGSLDSGGLLDIVDFSSNVF